MSKMKLMKGAVSLKSNLESNGFAIKRGLIMNLEHFPFEQSDLALLVRDSHNIAVLGGGCVACDIVFEAISRDLPWDQTKSEIMKELLKYRNELNTFSEAGYNTTTNAPLEALQNYKNAGNISTLIGLTSTLENLLSFAESKDEAMPNNIVPLKPHQSGPGGKFNV